MPLRLQLWTWHYVPEPTGVGPVAATLAGELRARGHAIDVVSAHPHYPPGIAASRWLPYRERRGGVRVTRLPLWVGHASTAERVRQELTYTASACTASLLVTAPDVAVGISPSFTSLGAMIALERVRGVPWVLWLQDILPDAAVTTGLVQNPAAIRAARALERAAYRSASRIVVISEAFRQNLLAKGVPEPKIELILNPATRAFGGDRRNGQGPDARILCMGNIGYSQGLVELVRAFEGAPDSTRGTRLVITGHGELADAVRAEIVTDRVELLGLVPDARLEEELDRATLGLVSQRSDITEFNLPSKLMNLMARGIPVVASVAPGSEAARIVSDAGAGWVFDSARPDALPRALPEILASPEELRRRGAAGLEFARRHFTPEAHGARFEAILEEVAARTP